MLKEELRLHYSKLRRGLSHQAIDQASIDIANQLLQLPIWSLTTYHIFLQIPHKKEVNTHPILNILSGKDKNIVVPRVADGTHFNNILLTDQTRLVPNRWGIPEPVDGIEVPPEKIDLVFLPLLAFDQKGHRVGYGKGFYDTFLGSCREGVIKVGVSLFKAAEQIEDTNQWDIAMDYCATPETVYRF